MRIAAAHDAIPLPEPAGWSPGALAPSTSSRAAGLLRGGLDAWRGVPERSAGVPLTTVQLTMLTPFLALHAQLPDAIVGADLARVRVHVGGVAHDAGNVATTIGTNIYVSDAAQATRLLSWAGRRWLAHELMHTVQWRRSASPAASDAHRDRTFLNEYVGAYVASDGSLGAGGFANALREWNRRRHDGEPPLGAGKLLHDTHPMEREAELVALAFRDATS